MDIFIAWFIIYSRPVNYVIYKYLSSRNIWPRVWVHGVRLHLAKGSRKHEKKVEAALGSPYIPGIHLLLLIMHNVVIVYQQLYRPLLQNYKCFKLIISFQILLYLRPLNCYRIRWGWYSIPVIFKDLELILH